jgi:predicted lipoprotein with Yx(FWY)xxD motif
VNRIAFGLCLVAVLALTAGGCGSGDGTSSSEGVSGDGGIAAQHAYGKKGYAGQGARGYPKETQLPGGAEVDGVVFAAEGAEMGLLLFDNDGYTLYTFSKDQGAVSSCYGACAEKWPPHLTEKQPEVVDASRAKLGTTKRKDGTTQITYAGHPLYTFAGDQSGETNGNGTHAFGGEWYAIRPSGERP